MKQYILGILLCTSTAYMLSAEEKDQKQKKLNQDLMIAVRTDNYFGGTYHAIKSLIDKKADVGIVEDDTQKNLLHMALFVGRDNKNQTSVETIRLLLEHKAHVNAQDKNGDTPLHWAAAGVKNECATLLLEGKAEINKKNKSGHTPLYTAINRNCSMIAYTLADAGASFTIKDHDGISILDLLLKSMDIVNKVKNVLES